MAGASAGSGWASLIKSNKTRKNSVMNSTIKSSSSPFMLNQLMERNGRVNQEDDSPRTYIYEANIEVKF